METLITLGVGRAQVVLHYSTSSLRHSRPNSHLFSSEIAIVRGENSTQTATISPTKILKLKYVNDGTKKKQNTAARFEFLFQRNRCAQKKQICARNVSSDVKRSSAIHSYRSIDSPDGKES